MFISVLWSFFYDHVKIVHLSIKSIVDLLTVTTTNKCSCFGHCSSHPKPPLCWLLCCFFVVVFFSCSICFPMHATMQTNEPATLVCGRFCERMSSPPWRMLRVSLKTPQLCVDTPWWAYIIGTFWLPVEGSLIQMELLTQTYRGQS